MSFELPQWVLAIGLLLYWGYLLCVCKLVTVNLMKFCSILQ